MPTRCWLAVVLACLAGPAAAQPAKPASALDKAGLPDDLVFLADDHGHVAAVSPGKRRAFFGDEKDLYEQRVIGQGRGKVPPSRTWTVWSPTVSQHADFEVDDPDAVDRQRWIVRCGERETAFQRLDEARTRKLLAAATFRDVLWKREELFLARDERGRYYYGDHLRREHGGKGLRLLIGKKGRMVEQRLVDIVWDTVGLILETSSQTVHVDLDKDTARRIEGKVKEDLVFVPLFPNRQLIYQELGIARGKLGVPCDEL